MKFKITYSSGLVEEVEKSDVDSIESFINSKFGVSAEEVATQGTTIELLSEDGEAVAVVETETPAV